MLEFARRKTENSPAVRGFPAGRVFELRNETRGIVIGDFVRQASSSADRRRGLLGRESLEPGEGLWILPCEGVHTFGMRFAIDLIYVDQKFRVRKLVHELQPRRISICIPATSVIELTAGSIAASGTRTGDRLSFIPRT